MEAGRLIAMSRYNIFSFFIAITFSLLYLAYALGFWYGSKLVQDGESTPGSVFTVSDCVPPMFHEATIFFKEIMTDRYEYYDDYRYF